MSTQQPAADPPATTPADTTSTDTIPPATIPARPKVGVATLVCRRNADGAVELLLGERAGSHGAGTWACPGGHLEYEEQFYICAARELEEETGLVAKDSTEPDKYLVVTNDVFVDEQKHYITIWVKCDLEDVTVEPKRMEPDKCRGWEWFTWQEIKSWCTPGNASGKKPFLPVANLAKTHPELDFFGGDLMQA
ncbi:nudix domain-containing protein [Xylariaceae sp. FL1272]|nr:nudix domain-containing protein [Xylariaceae sp. FL1272]